MSIKLRYGVWHCDFVTPSGKRIRQSLGTSDKKLAQELHDKLKSDSWKVERLGEDPEYYFDEACLRWLKEKQHKRTIDKDKGKIRFWLQHFKGRVLSTITNNECQDIVSRMRNRNASKGYPSQSSKYAHLAFIRSLLRIAANEWGWLKAAPYIKALPPRQPRIKWLTREQAQALIDNAVDYLKPVIIFALATGLRRSNILELEWSQVDLVRRVAWVNPDQSKNYRAIGVSLNDIACQVIREQIGRHTKYVFVRERKLKGVTDMVPMRVDANKSFKSAMKRAGIEGFRFHDLRHTWASWLIQSGVPLSALQEMGGWESIEMVKRYAHLSPVHLQEHAKNIDSILCVHDTNMTLKKAAGNN
ncbi:tyrosine-type recombinase/integrase [Xenorhabdus griffiniae]|nr:site-specific integrase [Xenorhabdus griffiniae]MBD1229264.1 site-specific integrase [Xenorhabdus griffiniae]MBE8589011.1 site-specific integrase [Xenorhabdus griffiniae]WMV73996.1 site-specific integrase [Xenorhabdus griffiniae]WNH03676.1 site-specific integrase [Xenorhabdus griffiniae]